MIENKTFLFQKEGVKISDNLSRETCAISYKSFMDAQKVYPKREEALLIYKLFIKDKLRESFFNITEKELVKLTNITLNIISAKD